MNNRNTDLLKYGDALLIVDVQNDFLPGGGLAVKHGEEVVPAINCYIREFCNGNLPIFATRDWHPSDHCSFKSQGGPWPAHCIANTPGAAFADGLELPDYINIVSKATACEFDAYSGFEGTRLNTQLHSLSIKRLFIGGLATDYCVFNTVSDALGLGYTVYLLEDAIHAVNIHPDDGLKAKDKMVRMGAHPITLKDIVQ